MPPTHPVIQAIQDAMPPEGTEMYKFYENGVKTLDDVKEYLRTWFIRQPGGYSREWDGAHYTLVMGFRRGYWSHQVFMDTDTGLYIFTCDEEKEIPPFVTGEFSSFEAEKPILALWFKEARFVQNITGNSKVPDSLSNGIAFSDFRGARKAAPPSNWQFKLQMNGVYVKYDSATSKLRLNTGTEMQFEIVKGDSIFDGSGQVACYALQETTTKHYLHVTTAGVVSMKPTFMNNDASYSFKMFTSDGGQTNTLYCSVEIPKVGTQQTNMEFPYKNAWLAYQSGTDTVYAAFWSTLTSTVTFWSYLTMNESPDVKVTVPMSQSIQEFPVNKLRGYTTTLSGYAYGNGTYTVISSREVATRRSWQAFDYNVSSSVWQVTDVTTSSTLNDWLQLQLPFGIYLESIGINAATNTIFNRTPTTFVIHGIRPGQTTLELLEIIDIVLDPTDLNAIDLSSVNSVCRWSSNSRFFDLSAGEEHYRLLAHVARSVRRPTIIDIGHFQGLSAAALSLATEKMVRSFDLISSLPSDPSVPTAIHIPNVRLEIGPN
eukprot:gene29379-5730_t